MPVLSDVYTTIVDNVDVRVALWLLLDKQIAAINEQLTLILSNN
jgi:hypothetical protein